jgi:hypothetical protein
LAVSADERAETLAPAIPAPPDFVTVPEIVPGEDNAAFTVVEPPAETDFPVWIAVPSPEAEIRTS